MSQPRLSFVENTYEYNEGGKIAHTIEAYFNGEYAGRAVLQQRQKGMYAKLIRVREKFRGRGIGKQLLTKTKKFADRKKMSVFFTLELEWDEKRAKGMLRRLGYRKNEKTKSWFYHPRSAHVPALVARHRSR